MVFSKKCLFLWVILLTVSGCSFVKLNNEVSESLESTIIAGQLSTSPPEHGSIIVAAYLADDEKRKITHYTILHNSGEFELLVGKGKYYVFAYKDENSNLVYEKDEPAGQYGEPQEVTAPAGGVVREINFVIPPKGRNIDFKHGGEISSVKPKKLYSRQAGAITSLDDERFSEEYGRKGYWEPLSFYREIGGNIYFLEEYDPDKIPILFVHGATGTPKGWQYFVDNIDRSRFQPWFFYYPTGARMKSMSYLLFWKLYNLQLKYNFDEMVITAHSMGGLVARSFLVDYAHTFLPVKLFVSLATPWGGDKMAEYGVQQSPAVIPSWVDMQPDGEFIQSLFSRKLPESVEYYMFSGHLGGGNPFKSNNDGIIALSSVLDLRPQSEAKMNYVFNEDHLSIISSEEVLAHYNTVINTFYNKKRASLKQIGGYLQPYFSYDYTIDVVKPRSIFILLRPVGKKHEETSIILTLDDTERKLGPFPPGDYLVNITAPGFESTENNIAVSIGKNKIKEMNFVLIPDGEIDGYVTIVPRPEDRPVGMPTMKNLPGTKEITIQSITLQGPGVHRILHPLEKGDVNLTDYYISRTDFCRKRFFKFFGVPAGDYEVVIKTQGYKQVVERYSVRPGKSIDSKTIELKYK
jgi:pimeloyl-ACP methyl ester carboxylesterase